MQIPSVVFQDNSEYGRIKIYTDAEEITKDNVVEIFILRISCILRMQ